MPSRPRKKAAGRPVPLERARQGSLAAAARDAAALAAALDPLITIDFAGVIHSASDSVARVFGWAPRELVGRNVSMLMPEPHHSAHDGYLAAYRRTGRTNILGRTREFEAVRKGGERFPVELSVSRVEPPGGGPPLFVGIIRDVSERKQMELELEQYRHRLEEMVDERTRALQDSQEKLRLADRLASIGTLAAGLGHDMNNVLLPVRAHLNALKIENGTAAGRRTHIERIHKGVAYLQQLADGLHFLAMDPEADDSAGGVTDLNEWWAQTGALLSKAVPRHVRVTAALPAELPAACIGAAGLTQAMLNLVVNGGEAIPRQRKRRQGSVRVWADATGAGRWVRLGVTDNGSGMSEAVRRRAFDMFFTTKPRGLGTGLGLALVRRVVDRAGGSVEIDSAPGRGTTVILTLPALERGRGAADAPVAAVTLADSRAASLVRSLLDAAGAHVDSSDDPSTADIWVVAPSPASLRKARAWRARHPRGRLVLFGPPRTSGASAWQPLATVTIADPDDLDAVRAALSCAMAEPGTETPSCRKH